jgi:hypothetical protein
MPRNNNHINKWGVADFERYHRDEMSLDRRHALEKAALEDPFLQDALDGYVFAKSPISDVKNLGIRITTRGERNIVALWFEKSSPVQLLKIAAMLVLLAGFSWLIFNHNKDKQSELAQLPTSLKKNASDANKIVADTATAQLEKSASKPNLINLDKNLKFKELSENTSKKNIDIDAAKSEGQLLAKLEEDQVRYPELSFKDRAGVVDFQKKKPESVIGNVVLTDDKEHDKNPDAERSNKKEQEDLSVASNIAYMSENAIPNTNNNQSLAIAPVFSNNNVNGNAVLAESSGMGNRGIGYNQNMADVQGEKSLKEVVITGYAQQAKSKRLAESTQKISSVLISTKKSHVLLYNVLPFRDSALFYQVLEQRIKNQPFNAVRGELVVYFDIDNEGFAKNISIKKSLGDSCDTEAIRIIQSAPAMKKIKKGKRAEAIFRF